MFIALSAFDEVLGQVWSRPDTAIVRRLRIPGSAKRGTFPVCAGAVS